MTRALATNSLDPLAQPSTDLMATESSSPYSTFQHSSLATFWLIIFFISGCSTQQRPPMDTVENLDLNRFMGQWHVLADVATPFDRDAFDPLETYRMKGDGVVETVYSYREDSASGPLRERHLKAFVSEESNAVWAMQIFWPVKAEYRVVFIDPNYETTIVGRTKRDFVWIMARDPSISSETFDFLLTKTKAMGYDLSKLRFHRPALAVVTSDKP